MNDDDDDETIISLFPLVDDLPDAPSPEDEDEDEEE
jgi:hypothetical protein